MTVESTTTKVERSGNAVATEFSFSPMTIFDTDELLVVKIDSTGTEEELTEGLGINNYSVELSSPDTLPSVGHVNYPASGTTNILAANESIIIKRVVDLLQETNLENQGGYFPEVQEAQFDKLVMIDLQQQEELDRSLKIPVSDATTVELPIASERASGFLSFDASGNAIIAAGTSADLGPVSAFINTLLDDADAATARATLGVADDTDLPTPVASTYLKRDSGNTAYETKTPQQVADDLAALAITFTNSISFDAWENVASAAGTTDITATTSNFITISGTETITGLGTAASGFWRIIRATGAFSITFDGATLIYKTVGSSTYTVVSNDLLIAVSAGAGVWYIGFVTLPIAGQGSMEAATSIGLSVTPARQHYHPGHPKAWCVFHGDDTGTNAPLAGYNVTSVERTATGTYTITLSVTMSSTNYAILVSAPQDVGTLVLFCGEDKDVARSTTTFGVKVINSGGAASDGGTDGKISVLVFGDI